MKKILSLILVTVMLLASLASLTSCGGGITYVRMTFEDFGDIVIEVDGDSAPKTAKNFVKLVKKGFYDGLVLDRAQAGFVLQGGSPVGDDEPKSIVGEFKSNGYDNPISHTRGVISMARSNDPDSASTTFFICLSDYCTQLDGNYAAFGRVVEGMDVVDAIVTHMSYGAGYMGFVQSEEYCVTIESAVVDKDYSK